MFSLIMEQNQQICNLTLFKTKHFARILQSTSSKITSSITSSKEYVTSIESTLLEMGVKTTKLQNLDSQIIKNMVNSYTFIDDFSKSSSDYPYKFYIYPPEDSPNYKLSSYTALITGKTNTAFFKAKYSFLNFDFYLKIAGVIGENGDLESIVPIFVGQPVIRTEDRIASITLELSNDAVVYGIIVRTNNSTAPNSTQVSLGVDGAGKGALGAMSLRNEMDSEENYKPITLAFRNLTNNVSHTIYYVASIFAPRDPLLSSNVHCTVVIPQNPLIGGGSGKRILNAEENDEF